MKIRMIKWLMLLFAVLPSLSVGQNTEDALAGLPDTLLIDSLFSQGMQMIGQGREMEVTAMAERMLQLSNVLDYRKGKGDSYYLSGRVQKASGDWPAALRHYFMAVREYEWTGDGIKLSETYTRMGDIYQTGGLHTKAIEYYKRARKAGVSIPVNRQAILTEKLADNCYLLREYDSAIMLYKELYGFYEKEEPGMAVSTLMQMIS